MQALNPSPWAVRLGYAGLIPFLGLAAALWVARPGPSPLASAALLGYGATIASFLGAIHWGLLMRPTARQSLPVLLWGVTPGLLGWVALYHAADAVQALCAFLLRCWRIAISTFVIYGVLLWGLGLGGGYLLAYRGLGPWPAMQHPSAFWMAGSLSLALTALVFVLMLLRVSRQPPPA